MFGRSKTQKLKDTGASGAELAAALAKDRKFRREVAAAIGHGAKARRSATRQIGAIAVARRLATDEALRRQIAEMVENLNSAWGRVEKKRSHRLRNTLLLLGIGGGVAAAASRRQTRDLVAKGTGTVAGGSLSQPRTITETIEVAAPISAVYNQWTQFEDFPLFMEGVDHVQQLDDTRLHWSATVGGKRNEWDAKILEQHADRQISWISEDGKATRGTVTFEQLAPERTLVRLSMSYKAQGVAETVGSVAGIDRRRVRGDLDRFKELIESRGSESGGWRGEIKEGEVKQS
jgi:uncharacterized membrane protein